MTRRYLAALGAALALGLAAVAPGQQPSPLASPGFPGPGLTAPGRSHADPDAADIHQLRQRIEARRQEDIREVREAVEHARSRVQRLGEQFRKAEADLAQVEALFRGLKQGSALAEPDVPTLEELPSSPTIPASMRGGDGSSPRPSPSDPTPAEMRTPFEMDDSPQPPRLPYPAIALPPSLPSGPPLSPRESNPDAVEAEKRELDRQIERLKAARSRLDRVTPG